MRDSWRKFSPAEEKERMVGTAVRCVGWVAIWLAVGLGDLRAWIASTSEEHQFVMLPACLCMFIFPLAVYFDTIATRRRHAFWVRCGWRQLLSGVSKQRTANLLGGRSAMNNVNIRYLGLCKRTTQNK